MRYTFTLPAAAIVALVALLALPAMGQSSGNNTAPSDEIGAFYDISQAVFFVSSFPAVSVPSLERLITQHIQPDDPAYKLVQNGLWTVFWALLVTLLGVVTFLLIILCTCLQGCCSCASDRAQTYSRFDNLGSRILLLLIVLTTFALIGIGIFSNYKLFGAAVPLVTNLGSTLDLYSSKFSFVIEEIIPIAQRYNLTIPQLVFTSENYLHGWSVSVNDYTSGGQSDGFKKTFQLLQWLASAPLVIVFVSALFLLAFLVFARGFCGSFAIVLAFIALFFVVILSVPYSTGSFLLAGECGSNIRQHLTNFVSESVNQTCISQVMAYYLFCKPIANESCNAVGNFETLLADRTQQLNATVQQQPGNEQAKQDLHTMVQVLSVVHNDLGNCVPAKSNYEQIEQSLCLDSANHLTAMLLVSILLFAMLFFTVFTTHLARYRITQPTDNGNTAEMDSYYRYHRMPEPEPYMINNDGLASYNYNQGAATSVGMVIGFVLILVITCFIIGSLILAATIGARPFAVNGQVSIPPQ